MLTLRVNATDVVNTLDNIATKQLSFATARALNATALDFQVAQRVAMHGAFTIRRQSFIERQGVKILKPADGDGGAFATKKRLSVTIGMDPKADFLAKFELGGEKISIGGGLIAVPTEHVLPNKSAVIPDRLRPRALFADPTSDVFIIRPGDSKRLSPGIYKRIGETTKRGVRRKLGAPLDTQRHLVMLYALFPETHIKPILDFEKNARATVEKRWAVNFSQEFQRAL